jgi:DNA-binding NtrC family response regulator
MKLLIVDDEERFLYSMQKLLKRKGYDVETTTSGETCLEILKEQLFDVVILDIKMPGIGGMETLKLIKRFFPTVEVIMLTGHGTGEYAVDALMWGAADFLIKPISVPDLIGKVEEASARRQILEDKIRIAKAIDRPLQSGQATNNEKREK